MKIHKQKQPLYDPAEQPSPELLVLDDVLDRVAKRYLETKEKSNVAEPTIKKKSKKRRT